MLRAAVRQLTIHVPEIPRLPRIDPLSAFATQYGMITANKKHLWYVVSATAKAKEAGSHRGRGGGEGPAACKEQQSDNATKSAQDYQNFGGQC